MTGKLYYWVANWSLSRSTVAMLLKEPVADMVDVTSSSLSKVLPHLHPNGLHVIAGYITGSSDIAWTAKEFDSLPKGITALRIDQSNTNAEDKSIRFIAKDVEPGASTVQTAIAVAKERISAGEDETIYVDQSTLGAVEDAAAHAGLPHGEIIGYQYASPTSNPNTPLPGSSATLREVNADLSLVKRSWLPEASQHPSHPSRPPVGSRLAAALVTFDYDDGHWTIKPAPSEPENPKA